MENQTQIPAKFTLAVAEERIAELTQIVAAQGEALAAALKRIEELESKKAGPVSETEMTADMARRMLNGDLKEKSHKEVAEVLKLSYGQVYSCRLQFTFKTIHKELAAAGFVNPWVKK